MRGTIHEIHIPQLVPQFRNLDRCRWSYECSESGFEYQVERAFGLEDSVVSHVIHGTSVKFMRSESRALLDCGELDLYASGIGPLYVSAMCGWRRFQ